MQIQLRISSVISMCVPDTLGGKEIRMLSFKCSLDLGDTEEYLKLKVIMKLEQLRWKNK
jgi:hypothetical protein